jgi:penicillin-insensitive murein endopeptidase
MVGDPMQWQWKWLGRIAIVTALVLFASAALARPGRNGRRRGQARRGAARTTQVADVPPPGGGSLSIGRTTRGRLIGGVPLQETENVKYRSGGPAQRYGTTEMIATLERVGAHVARAVPGARLSIGDISRPRGGRFSPHRSHRNGRDVDISFYWLDAEGNVAYPDRFVTATPEGASRDAELGLRFDDARNWELVSALVSDQEARAQYLFVARFVKERVIAEGRRRGAPDWLIERVETVLHQPSRGGAHRDHFHMRIYCSEDDRPRCVDEAPYHAWLTAPPPAEPALHARRTLPPGLTAL